MFLRLKSLPFLSALIMATSFFVAGQQPSPTPAAKNDEKKAQSPAPAKGQAQLLTAEQIVESAIVIYGFPGGRATLNQIRKTTFEKGRISVMGTNGERSSAAYQRWILRGDNLNKERIRFEQDFPDARYSMVHAEEKIFGIYNDSVFAPREDALKSFQNQILHSIESLLRYKENESTIALGGREKQMGVEFHLIDLTDKQGRKTRFYVSVKTFRVMALEYEQEGVKYKRKFYDYKYAQGTLVPYRTVLWANDKIVEESEIGTVTFGQKVDEGLFPSS